LNYYLRLEPWGVEIRRRHDDRLLLDLCYGWFTAEEDFHVSFGWRFDAVRGRDRLTAHRLCQLAHSVLRVPGNAEDVLEQLYGPHWRVPDQGYDIGTALNRDPAYLLSEEELRRMARSERDFEFLSSIGIPISSISPSTSASGSSTS
jgi:hypothetical protein